MSVNFKCIGKNKNGSDCSVSSKGLYCKRHEPKKTALVLKQNKDGTISKRNKTVIKRIESFMRRRRRFTLSFDGIDYGVHHSGQLYAQGTSKKRQDFRHIGEIYRLMR